MGRYSREELRKLCNELDEITDARFDVFWEAYPKRRDKITAKRAWRRINPSDEALLEILRGINRYMASGEWKDYQYIPYPATFLNRRRWEDEIGKGAQEEQPESARCLFKKGYVPRIPV